jgi:hypothetical protein
MKFTNLTTIFGGKFQSKKQTESLSVLNQIGKNERR